MHSQPAGLHLSQALPSSSHTPVREACLENEGKHPSNRRSAERRGELFPGCQTGNHFCFSRPRAESGNLRTRQEGLAMKEVGENNALPAMPAWGNEHPAAGGSPTSPTPTTTLWAAAARLTLMMLLRLGVARAASRRPTSVSPGGPAAPGSATPLRRSLIRPPEAAGAASPEAASAAARGSSSPPAVSTGTGPSLPAAPSAMAKHVSEAPGETARPTPGVQPPAGVRSGTGRKPRRTLSQRPTAAAAIAATLWRGDIAGAEASSGCGPGGQRAGAGRRRGAGRRCEREGEAGRKAAGGTGDVMRTPARRRQKAPGAGPGASRAGTRAAGAVTADGPPATCPPTAARRPQEVRRWPPLRSPVTGRERLVLTARGDWQASEPLRSRGSPGGFGPTNPHRGGVCPSAKNGMCAAARSPPGPSSGTGRGCAPSVRSRRHSEYILGSLETLKQPEGVPKMGRGGEEGGGSQGDAGGNTLQSGKSE